MIVHLRSLQKEDAYGMYEWMIDPSIVCFFRFDASNISVESCEEFIRSASADPDSRHYAIADEENQYLGTISLKDINKSDLSAEYAISTRKSAHGTGAAMQATKAILKIAFEEFGLKRVYLNVLTDNVRANRFYNKAGFYYDSTELHAVEIRGEWKNLNWYSITDQQYKEDILND